MKQAYRKLVKTWHPDCFPNQKHKQEAEEKINFGDSQLCLIKSRPHPQPLSQHWERDAC
ncbi:MAG: hypothetical protein PUP91_10030 [Rhizonema sp. PD37]|nr:hypothetical protein [Rhizonema sp. PD37]